MKHALIIPALALAGCATTPAGVAETEVERTIASAKTAEAFANCVAERLPAGAQLRGSDGRYTVIIEPFWGRIFRADFRPVEGGSIAETRSVGARWNASEVEACA